MVVGGVLAGAPSPTPEQFEKLKQIVRRAEQGPARQESLHTHTAMDPDKGAKIRVFWTGEKRWYRGSVDGARKESGKVIHHVVYEDGDRKWHHLPSEIWLYTEQPKASKRTRAAMVLRQRAPAHVHAARRLSATMHPHA